MNRQPFWDNKKNIVDELANIPKDVVAKYQQNILKYRHIFQWSLNPNFRSFRKDEINEISHLDDALSMTLKEASHTWKRNQGM
jgi:hypothetical protein